MIFFNVDQNPMKITVWFPFCIHTCSYLNVVKNTLFYTLFCLSYVSFFIKKISLHKRIFEKFSTWLNNNFWRVNQAIFSVGLSRYSFFLKYFFAQLTEARFKRLFCIYLWILNYLIKKSPVWILLFIYLTKSFEKIHQFALN